MTPTRSYGPISFCLCSEMLAKASRTNKHVCGYVLIVIASSVMAVPLPAATPRLSRATTPAQFVFLARLAIELSPGGCITGRLDGQER